MKPNILLIIADDHRSDAIGACGHPVVKTPYLDRLIARGALIERATIAGSLMPAVCSPSRAALFTGLHPFRADGTPGLVGHPPYEVKVNREACTLPERFKQSGYETFLSGKWHNDTASLLRSFTAGKAIFCGGMCDHRAVPVRNRDEIHRGLPPRVGAGFSTELFCGATEEFIRTRRSKDPFFACLALTSPHDPRTPPAAFRAVYNPAEMPLPSNFLPEHPFDNGELGIRDEQLLAHPLDPAALRENLTDYYGMITHHDHWVGRVLSALEETGQLESTLVVYVSDHGLALGSHGLVGKQNLYEHSIRVPLVIAGPGVAKAIRSRARVYSFDVYATLCELADVAAPAGLDSRSFLPMLRNEPSGGRRSFGAAYMDCQRMITDGRWKLIVYHVSASERIQLFDLEADPDERFDRSTDPGQKGRIADLRMGLRRWREDVNDRWWTGRGFDSSSTQQTP